MKTYTVDFYNDGQKRRTREVQAESHEEAFLKARSIVYCDYTHALVIGDGMGERYSRSCKKLTGVKIFKCNFYGDSAILVLIGEEPEIHTYASQKERDNVFESAQCILESAVFASETEEPKDTTASTEETSDSKSGSMLKKTSNGYAEYATLKDSQTLTTIDMSSGKDNAKDLAKNVWKTGSAHYPSKSSANDSTNFLVKVRHIDNPADYPHASPGMLSLEGKYMVVEKSVHDGLYFGNSYYWRAEWLEFVDEPEEISAIVLGGIRSIKDLRCADSMKNMAWEYVEVTPGISNKGKLVFRDFWAWAPGWLLMAGDKVVFETNHFNTEITIIPTGTIMTVKGVGDGFVWVEENNFIFDPRDLRKIS